MISLIVAMDQNNLIGVGNSLPWYRPADMKNFVNLTSGNSIIMGRKTYESIGKPLKNRNNVVITSNPELYKDKNNLVFASLCLTKIVLASKIWDQDIFIIGGASIYREFAPYIERMYITVINAKFPHDGNSVYFPWKAFEPSSWVCTEQRSLENDFHYVFDRG